MKLPISPRLLACAGFVVHGYRVADIGCDHGYLSIYLLQNRIASFCIASDINQQPLLSASRNAEKYGVKDRMTFCISDGVRQIPRDFDVMVCAGMGGDTMIHILEEASWLQDSQYRLILQCQSKIPMLRGYLSDHGWMIRQETVLRDGRFLYTIMEVIWNPGQPRLTPGEQYLSPALFNSCSPFLMDYVHYVRKGLQLSLAHQSDPEKAQALEELCTMEQHLEQSKSKEASK